MFCMIVNFLMNIKSFFFPVENQRLSSKEICPPLLNSIIYTTQFSKQLEVLNTISKKVFRNTLELHEIIKECYGIHEYVNDKNVVISGCYYQIKEHPYTHQNALFIYGLATHPDYRNQGAASSIIYSIINIYGHTHSIVLFVDKPDDNFLEGTLDGPLTPEELQEGMELIEEEEK